MLDADFKESADGMLGLPMYNSHFILALLWKADGFAVVTYFCPVN